MTQMERGGAQTPLCLMESDLWNACGAATLDGPLQNRYGCWSEVCPWSQITSYPFSPRPLPVNQTSFLSPFRRAGKARRARRAPDAWFRPEGPVYCSPSPVMGLAATSDSFMNSHFPPNHLNDISIRWNPALCLLNDWRREEAAGRPERAKRIIKAEEADADEEQSTPLWCRWTNPRPHEDELLC